MKLPSPIAACMLMFGLAVATASGEDAGDQATAAQQTHTAQQNIKLAEKLISNTVTVRILPGETPDQAAENSRTKVAAGDAHAADPANTSDGKPTDGKPTDSVTVCTGVALSNGQVVTFSPGASTFRYRVTLPDGAQADARIDVADQYSGLKLLSIPDGRLTGLTTSAESPQAGATVWTAAASGIERPSISRGIVAATERSVGNAALPAMLQCDLRTTETSSGAGVIDERGRLVGIVAVTDAPDERRGWTYAVPASHVARIVRQAQPGKLIELSRRRPTVGWTIGPGEQRDTVVVQRVFQNGPAERAGVQRGDVVCQTDERVIRNAYQAVNLILSKQPGDKVRVVVEKDGQQRELDIILGDDSSLLPHGAELRDREEVLLNSLNLPLRINEKNELERVAPQGKTRLPRAARLSELEMLRKQLEAYELVIRRQQDQLRRLERLQRELHEQGAPRPASPSGEAP